jgi:hypothetical protein
MTFILCNNPWEGLCFMMKRALEKEKLEVECKNMTDDSEFFKKHQIRTCPVLLVFDNEEVVDRITGVEDIIKKLKEHV